MSSSNETESFNLIAFAATGGKHLLRAALRVSESQRVSLEPSVELIRFFGSSLGTEFVKDYFFAFYHLILMQVIKSSGAFLDEALFTFQMCDICFKSPL